MQVTAGPEDGGGDDKSDESEAGVNQDKAPRGRS